VREENGQPAGLNSPFVFARGPKRAIPGLGEHTSLVLGEILSQQELQDLTNAGVIGKRENKNNPQE
jgi:crotonobetainyl-CoA:carnitine CoA-transferase CaiB-like acyl-CoA transferase